MSVIVNGQTSVLSDAEQTWIADGAVGGALGTAAYEDTTAFDAAGAASTVQSNLTNHINDTTAAHDDSAIAAAASATNYTVVTPDVQGHLSGIDTALGSADDEFIILALSDETSDIEVTTPALTFRMPYAMTVTEVRASLTTAATGSAVQIDINKNASSILSTPITIDAGDTSSEDATTPPVISTAALADNDIITIDIDAVGSSTAGIGAKAYLIGTR